MNIRIKRIAKKNDYTIGKMYIDGEYYCDTLEDKDRGLKQTDLDDSINTMLPWLIAMFFVVITDLAFGVRKSLKLGIQRQCINGHKGNVRQTCRILGMGAHGQLHRGCLQALAINSYVGVSLGMRHRGRQHHQQYAKALRHRTLPTSHHQGSFASRAVGIDEHMAEEIVNGSMPKQEVKDSIKEAEKERWERRSTHYYGSKKQTTEKK